ncbi:hypothetical protein BSKO_07531 [Bryopsis sp. KO-2023]|nr:hypothetical protein BSKO_07531 [Bryopsis sp. KO-2023]
MSQPHLQNGPERTSTVDFDEELNLALALSASEAEHLRANQQEQNRVTQSQNAKDTQEDDFKLALELQARELAPEEGPSSAPSPPQPKVDSPIRGDLCAGCGKKKGFGYIQALGKNWHAKCFKCGGCREPVHGVFIAKDGVPYHRECHRELFHEKCVVCSELLPSHGNRIVWSEHPFWREKYCQHHNEDGTDRCTGCERCRSTDAVWIRLEDGRNLCTDCQETIVVDTQDCQPLYEEIRQMYCELNLPFSDKPPLALVDQLALNDYNAKEGTHAGNTSQTRGMTLTEEYRSIKRVVQRGGSGWRVFPELVQLEKRHCSVTAILVLYGLPRLLTGSILAHEMMHAWLKLNQITGLSKDVEEGLCQLMGLIWLEKQQIKDPYENRLASFIGNQIRTHPSPIYGDGFRAAHESFQCYGLKSLVDHVRQTGAFPVPQMSS